MKEEKTKKRVMQANTKSTTEEMAEAVSLMARGRCCLGDNATGRLNAYQSLLDGVSGPNQTDSYFGLSAGLLRRLIALETVQIHSNAFERIQNVFQDNNEPDAEIIAEVLGDILEGDRQRQMMLEESIRAAEEDEF